MSTLRADEEVKITRSDIERIGETVNKPASTIYRWRKHNPELFQAVYEYAVRRKVISGTVDQLVNTKCAD